MRIYKSDGSYIVRPEDIEFGWNLSEIIIDEAIPNYTERNRQTKSAATTTHVIGTNKINFDESIEIVEDMVQQKIEKINNSNIKISRIKSVLYSEVISEGLPTDNNEIKKLDYKNIDEQIPAKTEIAKLIEPCSVESKMLLAVVHFAKYKHLLENKNLINFGNLINNSGVKFLINGSEPEDLQTEIENFHKAKEQNMLSLMMELILDDLKCDINDIKSSDNDQNESSDLGNSIESYENMNNPDEMPSNLTSQEPNYSGSSGILDRSIEKMCEETYELRLKIKELKKDFQADLIKVNSLIEEAQTLEKSLREKKYLDELLHLLNGDLNKITPKKWPFRILRDSNLDGVNLII